MNYLMTTILAGALMSGGIGLTTVALADEHGQMKKEGYDGKQCDRHKGYGGYHHGAAEWKSSLSDEQRKQYDSIKETYYQEKYKLKKEMKSAKMDLAKLITSDSPNQGAIDKQIDAMLKIKGKKMHLKVDHKIKVRKMLNTEQRVKFDEYVKNKATYCKKRKGP